VVLELRAGDPRLIGSYRLVGRLGSGGMGKVFLGRSAGGRLVAVKVIRDDLAEDPEFRARFRREVAAARSVSGLFTAPVVDADLDAPVPFLVTAYIAGLSLADAVSRHGPLPAASVLALAAGLAEGLGAIHSAGVVHRDLKPSNVLLAEDGPRVIDFGISRAAEASTMTRTGLVFGSPGFMSPEQAEGGEVGPPSDVFSLGAVLAFAAAGEGPFGAGSTAALVYRVVHSLPNLQQVPVQIRPLIERCLSKDARQRPGPGELLAELDSTGVGAGWLPAPVIDDLPQPAAYLAAAADAEGSAYSNTHTAAGQHPSTEPSFGRPEPGSVGPQQPSRRTKRRFKLAWLILALIAASAAGSVALAEAVGGPPTAQHPRTVQSTQTISRSTSGPAGTAPNPAGDVTAAATSQYTIRVAWADTSPGATGFNIDNGCPIGSCRPGASLTQRTGHVTSATFSVTPGTYQCFRVQAFNASGASSWSRYGCTSTPGLAVPGTQQWTNTNVTLVAGDTLGITASGQVDIGPANPVGPAGDRSCTPARDHPGSTFPAPNLPCWSLIARIGNGTPFEVRTSTLVTTASGRLYLGVNDDSFSGNSGSWTVNIKVGGLPPSP
jgi:eukaryotic-like serine/threonine-protein kinase